MNTNIELICKVCGNRIKNYPFVVKEMQLGTKDSFDYFECNSCKCIQICKVPDNLSKYYPEEYYSFQNPFKSYSTLLLRIIKFIKRRIVKYYCLSFDLTGYVFSLAYSNPYPWLRRNMVNFNSNILDIGCGLGKLLLSMERSGFKNLTGIDPFIENDVFYKNGVKIYKKDLFCFEGQFDFIMLHHSFEHMDDPLKILKKIFLLLKKDGYVLIRIPVTGGFAWRKYRESWVQLDAPRHFFIHSIQSIYILCKESGLLITDFVYDSSAFQFIGSEKYLRNIGLNEKNKIFSEKKTAYFQKLAVRLNKLNDGDSACFYLRKNN